MTTFYREFLIQCRKKDVLPADVCNSIGIGQSAASKWKRGITPKVTTVYKIAKYFNVPPERFGAESEFKLTQKEKALILAYRAASSERRKDTRLILGVDK